MRVTGKHHITGSQKAQAVIELAIFGAVVLYLIGLIISQGAGTSAQQDAQLQSMRLALLTSYNSAATGSSSRNSASFMLLEDRLSTGANKFGQVDRMPFMASGSGTMSKHLFKPIDWVDAIGDNSDIPVTDMRINGQHFALRAGAAARYRIRYFPVEVDGKWTPSTVTDYVSTTNAANGTTVNSTRKINTGSRLIISYVNGCDSIVPNPSIPRSYCPPINTGCEVVIEDSYESCSPAACQKVGTGSNKIAKRMEYEWGKYGVETGGYPPAYQAAVANDKINFDKLGGTNQCLSNSSMTDIPLDPAELKKFKFNRRYDLNRDGKLPDICCPDPLTYLVWQWRWASLTDVEGEIDTEEGTYPSWDVTGDLIEDTVHKISRFPDGNPLTPEFDDIPCDQGPMKGFEVNVIDWGVGDSDMLADPSDYPNRDDMPGLKQDANIKTSLTAKGSGTYFELKEGADANSSFGNTTGSTYWSSSLSKKEQTDFVERQFVLNKRMLLGGSLCTPSPNPKPRQRSVQECCDTVGCCSKGIFSDVTCVEMPMNGVKRLFIRSRIQDLRGRKWKTYTEPEL